ncbi:sugar ABC transporter ATP-binding protein [Phyllobacterium sp. OV277]|uniref:sugar ABC transporter ATP-binding protein n=1 Tax=Phyllobacterium sp. OV277 TaxID=1882772 RepID=UPI000883F038|nr:sugar ABC transporter ATP-binding protein [Phyllobacterium sp. OV277]SDP70917.1 monosaccharide ABC transporter ATP-binding protein, CUT2 family [Phyllobacterium sp. OV277]
MSPVADNGKYALRLRGLVKRFGGVEALSGATLEVERGTVHGLIGQNGAGKSTLIKILAGLYQPDEGSIEINDISHRRLSAHEVEKLGIHFIHQDRLLVPSFTVGESLFLGREPRLAGLPFLDRRTIRKRAEEILDKYFKLKLPANVLISELTAAQKQIVQITRALLDKPSILVFDEPTAALVRREADILFDLIRRLRADGITIIYISHYLNEIEALCDRATILRNGKDVATIDPRATPASKIASLMVARDIEEMFPKISVTIGEPVLTAKALSKAGKFQNVSLDIRQGEIVGLTGLLGSGAKDLVRVLFGLEAADTGEITIEGEKGRPRSPVAAVAKRLALVPEDRRGDGVALGLSVAENITLASLKRFTGFGFLKRDEEHTEVDRLIEQLAIKTNGRFAPARTLSGGNQQKVALAKWLSRKSTLYILDEPTVGVDIGSKVEIYNLIGKLAERGAGILILSSDLPELIGITDRILVLYRGAVVREFQSSEATPDEVLAEATGALIQHYGEQRHVS